MTIETPCIKLCVVDRLTGHCIGCGRSLDEVAGWAGFSEAKRREIMAALPDRLKTLASERPRRGGRRGRLDTDPT